MGTTETQKEFSFEDFKIQLHFYIKNNFGGCSDFLTYILEAKSEDDLKRHFRKYNVDVYEYLGGNPVDDDDIDELKNDINNLEDEINDLEGRLEDLDGSIDGTLVGEYKLQHFIKYKDEYSESELEELLQNGKKYLKK